MPSKNALTAQGPALPFEIVSSVLQSMLNDDDYDIEARLAHRRLLRALMCRAWLRPCQTLLAETMIFRKLHDLDAVEAAVARGYLDVSSVRRIFVDPAASGLDSSDRHDEEDAWALVDERYRVEGLDAVDSSDARAR